ncbi:MAG: MFS transporter [Chloroflexota bacterium]
MHFIVLLGIVSLFGDVTYEGARSVIGPYLATLGASASIVGLISGVGEFGGYALRLASGYLADRTKAYWLFTFIGYGLLVSIPLLAFTGYWQLAAVLIILERMGKAIRSPARDTMLSYATKEVGRGWGFAVHEALDQIGAIIGPIVFSVVLLSHAGYREGFTMLWIPALLSVTILAIARKKVPSPRKLETPGEESKQHIKDKLPMVFWLYTIFSLFSVAGFANFQLISYHLKVQAIVPDAHIPIIYAVAMGVDAVAALLAGKTYDRIGLVSLLAVPLLTLPIPFLAFSYDYKLVLTGMVLWGVVMGIQETIMRAAIADITPVERRGFAYGIFNTVYGASWFLGSALIGLLYEHSINHLIMFVVAMELVSIPLFFLVRKTA